jgi:hypothetical protein
MRDYLLLSIGLFTDRHASELIDLRWGDVKYIGTKTVLEFTCKGGKVNKSKVVGRPGRRVW